jgi:hypothetical protein
LLKTPVDMLIITRADLVDAPWSVLRGQYLADLDALSRGNPAR